MPMLCVMTLDYGIGWNAIHLCAVHLVLIHHIPTAFTSFNNLYSHEGQACTIYLTEVMKPSLVVLNFQADKQALQEELTRRLRQKDEEIAVLSSKYEVGGVWLLNYLLEFGRAITTAHYQSNIQIDYLSYTGGCSQVLWQGNLLLYLLMYSCWASANEARLMITSHLRFCYVYIHILYIYIYIYVCTLHKQVLQLNKLGGTVAQAWWLHLAQNGIMLCSRAAHSSVVSSTLWHFFRRWSTTSRSDFAIARVLAPSPTLCALVQCAVVSCSVLSADSHSELSISTNAG